MSKIALNMTKNIVMLPPLATKIELSGFASKVQILKRIRISWPMRLTRNCKILRDTLLS